MSNIIIESNTIKSSSDGYFYDTCIFIGQDSIVRNNIVSGIKINVGTPNNMVNMVSSSSNFTGNSFIRNATTINAYINDNSGQKQVITGNKFDSQTVDGTSYQQVKGIVNSVYERNINQVSTVVIQLEDAARNAAYIYNSDERITIYKNVDVSPTYSVYMQNSTAASFPATSTISYVTIEDSSASSFVPRIYAKAINLAERIPHGSKLLNAAVSFYYGSAANTLSTGANTTAYSLFLNSATNMVVSNDDITSGALNITSNIFGLNPYPGGEQLGSVGKNIISSASSIYNFTDAAHETSARNTTKTLTLDLSSNNIYIKNSSSNILFVKLGFLKTANNFVDFVISPVVVQYVYQG